MLCNYSFLGDVVAIDEPYICGPFSNTTSVCHYNGCLKFEIALLRCPKCFLVIMFVFSYIVQVKKGG